jgi:S1-C subfamily serine protease
MIQRINQFVLDFINKYSNKIVGALAAVIVISAVYLFTVYQSVISTPLSVEEFARTSVKITNLAQNSGGSGSVYRSTVAGSYILTNQHVCEIVKRGGFVLYGGSSHLVQSYQVYNKHDLCLVKISSDLGVNTKIADEMPRTYARAHISGHPALLPHVLTEGNFSGTDIISVIIGVKRCTGDEPPSMIPYCIFMGGIPIVRKYESQLVTGTILPGSSGSAVFNSSGEISGVVFAGRSRELSYAFIVPYSYVRDFLRTVQNIPVVNIDYLVSLESEVLEEEAFSCGSVDVNSVKICAQMPSNLIWNLK